MICYLRLGSNPKEIKYHYFCKSLSK